MDIHELFEQHYSDHNDTTADNVRSCRMSNGSYNNLPIARAFRMFRAGFEANTGDKLKILGYLNEKDLEWIERGDEVSFAAVPTQWEQIPVYVKQCDTHKTGENHEKQ